MTAVDPDDFYGYQGHHHVNQHTTWRSYSQQNDALRQYYGATDDVHVFSKEINAHGGRSYILASIDEFYEEYYRLPIKHFYELIPHNTPCHLYADLEFYTAYNDINGDALTNKFIHLLTLFLEGRGYPVTDTVLLDSSRPDKYSKHLIVHLNAMVFASNSDCKRLMIEFQAKHPLVVATSDGKTTFYDMSVYSKNRQFRLYLSSKYDSDVSLTACFQPSLETFKSTLVTFCPFHLYQSTMKVSPAFGDIPRPTSTQLVHQLDQVFDHSPFPSLDHWVHSHIQGNITKVIVRGTKVIYSVSGNRYCERIKREHKSNGIYYIVDRVLGVMYQCCHDPDCRGFKGSYHTLSDEVFFDVFEYPTYKQTILSILTYNPMPYGHCGFTY